MTVDLAVSVLVGRDTDHGGPTDLNLNDWTVGASSGIAIARGGAQRGGVVRRIYSITGEGVEGDTYMGAERGMIPMSYLLYLFGTPSQRETLRALLTNANLTGAFDQEHYLLTETVRGVTRSYRCWPADVVPGDAGAIDEFQEMANREALLISFLRRPGAVSGSF